MNARLKKLVSGFSARSIDALLITNDTNIAYLTGFPASESWLFVTRRKAFYITDFRYILEAKRGLKGIKVVQYAQSIFKTLALVAGEEKVKKLGFDQNSLSVAQFQSLKKDRTKGLKFIAALGLVESMRETKTTDEIARIKKALRIHHQALKHIKRYIRPGITEREVLQKLESFVKSKKAGFSFDPIVASGPNSCYPHARVTGRKIRNNEPVLLDMGIDVDGYKSDLTRMFFLGKIPNLVREINAHVREAHDRAIRLIGPGIPVGTIDREARNYLKEKNLNQYFGHALGHGVGLDIHESPKLFSNNTNILRAGMVVTIEPAVYLPGKFGIRIEDMVLITKTGKKVLSAHID